MPEKGTYDPLEGARQAVTIVQWYDAMIAKRKAAGGDPTVLNHDDVRRLDLLIAHTEDGHGPTSLDYFGSVLNLTILVHSIVELQVGPGEVQRWTEAVLQSALDVEANREVP